MPREIAPGLFWMGECQEIAFRGRTLHSYNAVYLLVGDGRSILVDSGHPLGLHTTEGQIESLLEAGAPMPSHVFLTHTETPHAGGVGRLLDRFPELIACGDVTDLHLVFPQFADRLLPLNPGDSLDLGDSEFRVLEAVLYDHITTRWGFDTRRRVLFSADGFAYSHHHEADQCGRLANEVESELDVTEMVALFAFAAFNWTSYVDLEPFLARLEELMFEELDVALVAPTHGLPIVSPKFIMPRVRKGMQLGSDGFTAGSAPR